MKKIISTLLAVFTAALCLPAYAAYSDVPEWTDYYASSIRLQDLGIISGYEDGTFRPENNITRAEFTKVVVCMMDKEKDAAASAASSGFYDVQPGSWSAPYINYAVSQDILSGYSDGSFAPNRTISYAEALTILLRTLGYTETDVGYYWPNNYVSAASSMGVTAGMDYDSYAPLNRATAAILVDRTLFAKPAASKNANTYLDTVGCKVLEDALILDHDTSSSNISILSGNLKLNSASTYITRMGLSVTEGNIYEYAVIDKDGYLAAVREYNSTAQIASETAIVSRLTGNTIEYTTLNGSKGTYKADDSFVTYYDNNKMTFASAKSHITNGVDVTFYGNAPGLWNIAVIGTSNDVEPVLASHSYTAEDVLMEGTPINHTRLTVYRNGEAATLSDIKSGDVVYYNTKTNIMDVYSKKITGIYYSAAPSKAYVESVTVGGKSYEIGHSTATNKLDASTGAFEIGDKITLLLGKDDKVAFCVDNASGFDYYSYGVLLSTAKRTSEEGANEGLTETIAQMFMPDGQIQDIVTDKQYKDNIGDLMHITYSGGVAALTKPNNNIVGNYYGAVDKNARTINGKYFLQDAAIIQRTSDKDSAVAECELLDFDSLTSDNISADLIINVISANKFGDIGILYVENLENTYNYGVVGGFIKRSDPMTGQTSTNGYKIFADSILTSYNLGNVGRITTSVGAAVGYRLTNGQLSKLVALTPIATGTTVGAAEGSRIMVNDKIYKMSADAEIVDISSTSNMRTISIEELDTMQTSSVTLYSDKALSSDGIVRVVTVKE